MSDHSFQKPDASERVIRPVTDDLTAKQLSSARIAWFTKNHLKQLAAGDGGWSKLFLDSVEHRYWELTFPNGSEHGGGAPELRELNVEAAREKYGSAVEAN